MMDSDELDGDLNLSETEEGAATRNVIRSRNTAATDKKREKYAVEFDTNVFRVSLECLQHKGQLVAGDAQFCSNCQGVFNNISNLLEENGNQIWTCEFCNTRNEVMIGEEEIPQVSEVTYMIEAAAQAEQAEEEKKDAQEKLKPSDTISVVFCIDVSGSMRLDGRLDGAKKAIISQISSMFENNGKRKLGIVAFDNNLEIIGDGVEKSHVIDDSAILLNYDQLLEIGKKQGDQRMRNPVSQTKESLLFKAASL